MECGIPKSATIGQDVKDHPFKGIRTEDLLAVLIFPSMVQKSLMEEVYLINSGFHYGHI